MSDSDPATFDQLLEQYRKNPFYQPISDVLHWREVVDSALLFSIINLFFILLLWSGYSVVTLVSLLLLYWIIAAAILVTVKKSNPFEEKLKSQNYLFSYEQVKPHADLLFGTINLILKKLVTVFQCSDNLLSLKFAVGFWLVAMLGKFFSTAGLIYLVTLWAFIFAPVYEQKKTEIDQGFETASTHVTKVSRDLMQKLPPNIKSKFE